MSCHSKQNESKIKFWLNKCDSPKTLRFLTSAFLFSLKKSSSCDCVHAAFARWNPHRFDLVDSIFAGALHDKWCLWYWWHLINYTFRALGDLDTTQTLHWALHFQTYPAGNSHIPSQGTFENDFPFPKVGYVIVSWRVSFPYLMSKSILFNNLHNMGITISDSQWW